MLLFVDNVMSRILFFLLTAFDSTYRGNLSWLVSRRSILVKHATIPLSPQPKQENMKKSQLSLEESIEIMQVVEINNALAVILGNAQLLLLKNTVASEDRAKLKAIEMSSFRIQGLVERMIESKKTATSQTPSEDRLEAMAPSLNPTP
jgi:nitrogen-specific signal transduction histidine kinase